MRTVERKNIIIVNSKNLREKEKYKRIIRKRRRISMKNHNNLKFDTTTSGQRSAKALRMLKEGFANIEISKDDPVIKNILEGMQSYEK